MRLAVAFALVFLCASLVETKAQSSADPSVIVEQLYGVQKAESPLFNQTTDRAILYRFFRKDLADAIWKDAVAAQGEIGALDFDPLIGSQDPQITDFTIMETGWGGDKKFGGENDAVVQVTFNDAGKEQMVSFQFERGKNKAWKIWDVRYPDGRLLAEILAGTTATPEPEVVEGSDNTETGNAAYQILEGTASPDGKYALAWGIQGVAVLQKYLESGAAVDEEKVGNYLVDVEFGKIVTTLADAQLWLDSKMGNVRDTALTAAWATNDFVVVDYEGRGNVFLRAIKLQRGKVAGSVDFQDKFEKDVRAYLARKHPAAYKRSQKFLVLFLSDLAKEGDNSWSVTASTGVSKDADDAADIDVRVQVRFFIEGEDDALKYTLLTVDKETQ